MRNILILSAHTDDAEVACGATIAKLCKNKMNRVIYIAFSPANESLSKGFKKDITKKECAAAVKKLGVELKVNFTVLDYEVRKFPEKRQDILESLIAAKELWNPQIVFCPSSFDIHQDHQVMNQEAIRAFRNSASIYGYSFIWNIPKGECLNMFCEVDEELLAIKEKALQCYKSQIAKKTIYFERDFVKTIAMAHGAMCGFKYAEAFEVIRERICLK